MAASSLAPRLTDILEAIEHIRAEMMGMSIDAFEADWRKRWLVKRGVEIISETSRRLTEELKDRHPEIPWVKVAGIGNVLRHEYEGISAPVMWKLVQDDLTPLERVCREELAFVWRVCLCPGLIGIDFILLVSRDLLSATTPQSACGIVALFDCWRASD